MMANGYTCKICGWQGLSVPHAGAVDCITAYRTLVDELRSLLPQGKQVLCAPIDRETTARLWIDGPTTDEGLERLLTYLGFMRKAWFLEAHGEHDSAPSAANPTYTEDAN